MLEIGSIIDGKYKILNIIGKGGMSVVYLAMNEKANKPWAIKEVRKDGVWNFDVVKQGLIVETDMLKRFKHPNLPSIVDVIDSDGTFLIVMDYIEGKPLSDYISEQELMSQELVIDWAKQLCDVLEYLHTRKPPIIYRDMKPSNIMLNPNGKVTLIDFGTAREFKVNNIEDTTCLGTQGYAAPEQFGGQGQTDARTDIYCLGTTLYHLLTGHNPSSPPYEIYPIRHWIPTLSTGLENIVLRCTQRNPEDRYQSCSEVMYALEHYEEIDDIFIKKQKRKLGAFLVSFFFMLVFFSIGIISRLKADVVMADDFNLQMELAESTEDYNKTILAYLSAISINPESEIPYLKLIEEFTNDLSFSEEEAEIVELLRIGGMGTCVQQLLEELKEGTKKYQGTNLDSLIPLDELEKNQEGYGQVCYKIAEAYWLYYDTTTEVSKKILGSVWFKRVVENEIALDVYKRKANIYQQIGEFYASIAKLQYEGNDDGEYSKHWENLKKLKEENDKNPNQEAVTVRLYAEIVSQITTLSGEMKRDGVKQEELKEILARVKEDFLNMQTNNSLVRDEINNQLVLCDTALRSIKTAYENREEDAK